MHIPSAISILGTDLRGLIPWIIKLKQVKLRRNTEIQINMQIKLTLLYLLFVFPLREARKAAESGASAWAFPLGGCGEGQMHTDNTKRGKYLSLTTLSNELCHTFFSNRRPSSRHSKGLETTQIIKRKYNIKSKNRESNRINRNRTKICQWIESKKIGYQAQPYQSQLETPKSA